MRERPILFSAPMVRAILEGRKTQTRRAVKRIPWRPGVNASFSQARAFNNAGEWRITGSEEMTAGFRCPYGQPGDRLWVKEAHSIGPGPDVPLLPGEDCGSLRWPHVTYTADGAVERRNVRWTGAFGRPRSPIHMYRWASRITLEVTGVRMGRLQDISEADAIAEGIHRTRIGDGYEDRFSAQPRTWADAVEQHPDVQPTACAGFRELWESINGLGSWLANPWVWVVEFKRVAAEVGHEHG